MTPDRLKLVTEYIERVAACGALSVASALIGKHAEKIVFGPWVPGVFAALLFGFAFYLMLQINIAFTDELFKDARKRWIKRWVSAALLSVLNLGGQFFLFATVDEIRDVKGDSSSLQKDAGPTAQQPSAGTPSKSP